MQTVKLFIFTLAVAVANGDHSRERMSWGPTYYYPPDALETTLTTCLNRTAIQGVDVIIDIAAAQTCYSYGMNQLVARFVDVLSQSIPQANFYSIILHGNGASTQTRYYLSMANIAKLPVTTTTTQAPVFWGRPRRLPACFGVDSFVYTQQTLSSLLRSYLDTRSLGTTVQLPTQKEAGAPATAFTVVITDGQQQTPVANYASGNNIVYIDIGGNLAKTTKGPRNILVPPTYSSDISGFLRTVRYQICQNSGGI